MLLAHWRSVFVALEQPHSSSLFKVPFVRRLARLMKAEFVHVWLGGFGAPSPKPIRILSTCPWAQSLRVEKPLRRPASAALARRFIGRQGKVRYTGHKAALRASAAYPPAFGDRVASLFTSAS